MLCSSFCVNSTITWGIKHLEISFSSTFSFFFLGKLLSSQQGSPLKYHFFILLVKVQQPVVTLIVGRNTPKSLVLNESHSVSGFVTKKNVHWQMFLYYNKFSSLFALVLSIGTWIFKKKSLHYVFQLLFIWPGCLFLRQT